jgi:hypothetical protein
MNSINSNSKTSSNPFLIVKQAINMAVISKLGVR